MRLVQFLSEQSYGPVNEIALPIKVCPPAAPTFIVSAILDTGAQNTFFDNSLAPRLGIVDISTGRKITVREASDRESDGFIHDVEVELLGRRITIPVTFVPTWSSGTDNLLGMEGVFNPFVIGIDHQVGMLYARPA
jgi:predicted aspartyl protease